MRSPASPENSTPSGVAESGAAGSESLYWRMQHSGSVANIAGARTTAEQESAEDRFTFSHDELSPDGLFHICYGYTRRGHEALVIEPLISLSATGEVLVNLWRSGLTGWAESFRAEGFRLIVSDPYGTSHLEIPIDVKLRRFQWPNAKDRPLVELRATLLKHVAQTRRNSAAFQRIQLRESEREAAGGEAGPVTNEIQQRVLQSINQAPDKTPPASTQDQPETPTVPAP